MFISRASDQKKMSIRIGLVENSDYKNITKTRFSFDWKKEKTNQVYKLTLDGEEDILGLVSISFFENEERVEIRLLAVSIENVGKNKIYIGIAGELIAFVARIALRKYGALAAVSLVSKTEIEQHYIDKYGFERAGKSLCLDGIRLIKLIEEYKV